MLFKVMNEVGVVYGEADTFKRAIDLGNNLAPIGKSFFVKEGKRKREEIDALFRSEIPHYRMLAVE